MPSVGNLKKVNIADITERIFSASLSSTTLIDFVLDFFEMKDFSKFLVLLVVERCFLMGFAYAMLL